MSLPPGFLDELRTRISLSQVVGRKVTWDMRKSNQGKGDFWAPCPFHQEKSASFHVDDRKGFYYCFGCHAKGDAIGFVKETENVGFMEAVEILAREAGMPMPARDPQAAAKQDRRSQLAEIMEEAVRHYRLMLGSRQGEDARRYLDGRGLSQAARDRWEIGFAPDARQGVFQVLTGKGFAPDLVVASGLCARPDDGGAPYDRFRGRIIFPIRDARGRAISLGGRAMDPNARAKYLNGPETDLFDKGRNLFNHGPAREAAGKGDPLVVAEGYMDTIALSEAGFRATVAPLGTAITEDQLRLMWRIADEPVIALDGDAAGIRAALRVVDLALPLLEAGKSLRFAVLPVGMDPDDLIKSQGAQAFRKVLEAAEPMVGLLWQRETEGKVFDSPERRAALDKTLRAAIARIADPSIRHHYGEEIKQRRWELFGIRKTSRPFVPGRKEPVRIAPSTSARQSLLAMAEGEGMTQTLRVSVILAGFAGHPSLIGPFESALERLGPLTPEQRHVRDALLQQAHGADHAMEAVAQDLETLLSLPHVRISPPIRHPDDVALARQCLAEEFAKLDAARGTEIEIREAMEDMEGLADEGLTWRLAQAAEARNRVGRSRLDDSGDLGEDRSALSDHLRRMIEDQVWIKKKS
ncbi:DNA primase [Falsirhodobacter halotolerans]|uniref:DNA primase n=1 Tax=Falsirhodobacter halotolerans TaxID=1146892 RepID=UPI001FD54B32|nr:DNA primase [Falsirhodobacter halotolerans]MCJ8139682.1 DNA primase [Falsirhodobacter halotolerans]